MYIFRFFVLFFRFLYDLHRKRPFFLLFFESKTIDNE